MNPTFDAVREDLPPQGPFDWFQRPKLIHSVGCIASSTFTPTSTNKFTGIFQGSNYGFVRFSTAASYDATPQSFTPGISLKFLRDGIPSANFMSMYSLEGSDSFNFFTHDLTNHVPNLSLNASEALRLLGDKFMEASDWPIFLGLSDVASFDEHGKQVAAPVFPYRLVFQALPDLKAMFSKQFTTSELCTMISKVPAPRVIYNVYAETDPNDTPQLIGHLSITSQATSSFWADSSMFFEHKRMEDDFGIRPDWVSAATEIIDQQAELPYFNGYPDLPDL
jgi:hypothetical protein